MPLWTWRIVAAIAAVLVIPPAVLASLSNYNAYHYDMTTPMFTPDGRILQVEYASLAPTHSSPMLVLSLQDDVILMVSTSKGRGGQDRLVQLSPNVVVGLNGILADSVALLQKVLEYQERQFRMYGGTAKSANVSFQQVATAIGDACQVHAFGGGIRPFGSVMLVCGLEKKIGSETGKVQMAMTDPSGGVVKILDKDKKETLFVGGTKSMQDRMKRDIDKHISSRLQEENKPLQHALRVAAKALLKEQIDTDSSNAQESKEEATENENDNGTADDLWLEAIILSPQHGIYKLSDQEVESLVSGAKSDGTASQ